MKLSADTILLIKAALREDIGAGDRTARLLVPVKARGKAVVVAREAGIFCGAPVLLALARLVDRRLKLVFKVREGRAFRKNQIVLKLSGPVRSLLAAERTLLNFLGHLSGAAAQTRAFVRAARGVKIFDTRKTTPGMRELEKYAVRCGGGFNHRMGLWDGLFVKENHRRFGQLKKLRKYSGKFVIEARNLREMRQALALKPAVILLDNFTPRALARAVREARRASAKIQLEASGGITRANVSRYASAGVDRISAGALTHSARPADFTMLIQ